MKYKVDDKYLSEKEFFGEKWVFHSQEDNKFFFTKSGYTLLYQRLEEPEAIVIEKENWAFGRMYDEKTEEYKLFIKMIEKHYPEVLL